MKLALLPIDNRPVCYTLPIMLTNIDTSIELFIPKRNLLGGLTKSANIEELFLWLKSLPQDIDAIILTLDTIAYGGLIPSRRCSENLEEIKNRIYKLKEILTDKNCKIYAFSSIMRISNNNYAEEEKAYWSKYGKEIYTYSYNTHKNNYPASHNIPKEILQDYLNTRNRNFEINKIYLKWYNEGLFETLIFSKDDCAEYGFNVQEAIELKKLGGIIKTGADEIPLSLLAKAIYGELKIYPIFTEPESKYLISNYEDISIEESVKNQIELAGCSISDEKNADIILYVNNFKKNQGEIVMKIETQPFESQFITHNKPYMVADVRFANGADNNFVKEFLKNKIQDKYFFGYSAWNTSANTLGSLICGAKIKYLSKEYNIDNFKKLQTTRFLDDWAYQANIRQTIQSPNIKELTSKMKNYENIIKKVLNTDFKIKYTYPWNRLFEVEIEYN